MNIKQRLLLGLGVMLIAGSAQAGLIVKSIDLAMVETDFNSRTLRGMSDEQAAFQSFVRGFMPAYNDPDKLICQLSLEVFDNVSSRGSCDGPRRNIGTLFAISGAATSPAELQLGLDWGRGGFSLLAMTGLEPEITRYKSDIWWKRNWNHRDVLDFIIPETQQFTLLGLGFERCCDGSNSARWRSLGTSTFSRSTAEGPGAWQSLAVNVLEPTPIYLLGIGLLAFACIRRARPRNQPQMLHLHQS